MDYQTREITRMINMGIRSPICLISRATSESLKPRWLWFGVTDRCNSRCIHCNIWRKRPTKNILTPKEIEKTLSDPLFRKVEYILNSGGEPTLRNDLEEILLIEHRVLPKARIQLSTNGLLPKQTIDTVKSAIEHGIDIDVGVSLDGVGEKHDLIRGIKGNFERVDYLLHELVALRKRHKDKIRLTIGFTLSDHTLNSLEQVKAYAKKLNVNFLVQWYNISSFYGNIGSNLASNKDLVKTVQSLPALPIYDMWRNSLMGKTTKFQCFAMYTFCVLKCNGDIAPCLSLFDVTAGNVRKRSPTEIWHSPAAKKARAIVKKCPGCLNDWGVNWSFASSFYPYLLFYLKHPHMLLEKLRGK